MAFYAFHIIAWDALTHKVITAIIIGPHSPKFPLRAKEHKGMLLNSLRVLCGKMVSLVQAGHAVGVGEQGKVIALDTRGHMGAVK